MTASVRNVFGQPKTELMASMEGCKTAVIFKLLNEIFSPST